LKKPIAKVGLVEIAQGVGPEFKLQHWEKKKKTNQKTSRDNT
jgi:hypothetical protein